MSSLSGSVELHVTDTHWVLGTGAEPFSCRCLVGTWHSTLWLSASPRRSVSGSSQCGWICSSLVILVPLPLLRGAAPKTNNTLLRAKEGHNCTRLRLSRACSAALLKTEILPLPFQVPKPLEALSFSLCLDRDRLCSVSLCSWVSVFTHTSTELPKVRAGNVRTNVGFGERLWALPRDAPVQGAVQEAVGPLGFTSQTQRTLQHWAEQLWAWFIWSPVPEQQWLEHTGHLAWPLTVNSW